MLEKCRTAGSTVIVGPVTADATRTAAAATDVVGPDDVTAPATSVTPIWNQMCHSVLQQ